ncbi:rRNA maturation RNase YbeY [Candidatus Cytomitobacter indipagum]|uniref:Endoribonuclease YbeY n=1 Tax=Candidatus Cytomitobacter indipagum TaxID=2601575 RepID=A0A5C0UEE8_9PROT|nr:rRNA maturation RNase YbeY [Candidatus Cytomitobacter indipagum]QEK38139.1 rRNA maturation RNase YbeY [Candidatus Cytomitobacter indipagum]
MSIEIKPVPKFAKYWKINTRNIPHTLETAAVYSAKKAIGFRRNMHNQEVYLTIHCVSPRYMKYLSKKHRNKNTLTNVLSFPADMLPGDVEGPRVLGDIFLCNDVIKAEAEEAEKSFEAHFLHLVAHGTLHLIGYDHEEENDALVMEDVEKKIMKSFNIANPYA